jgi:hypothetical protein
LETFFRRVCRRGSVARGSVWDELDELLDELDAADAPDLELEEVDAPDLDLEELDVPDLELDELDDPDFPDVDELEDDGDGWAGDPSLTATSKGPFTPGPKYFAVRS